MRSNLLCIALLVLGLADPTFAEAKDRGKPSRPSATSRARELCGKDRKCCVVSEEAAGKDRAGHALTIVRLNRACGKHAKTPGGGGSGDECQPFQNWLAVRDDDGKILSRQLLTEECNDGYGAAGVGEDSTQTGNGRFTHERDGGSAWRWSHRVEMTLDPPRIANESWSGFWTLGPDNQGEGRWDWESFQGGGKESVPRCDKDGEMPEEGSQQEVIETSYVTIPKVALPSSFIADGWKRLGLGRCSARVDGESEGFHIYGKKSTAEDSRFSVVATSAGKRLVLFVEVWDDRWVGDKKSERWLRDDHLELWLSRRVDYATHCTEKQTGSPEQWAIRITDGRVFPAMGATTDGPKVQRALGTDKVARLRIELPAGDGIEGIALVYSDSDDGKRQKRLIGTSKVKLGWAASLGVLHAIAPEAASCVANKEELTPVLATPRREPDEALWGM